MRGGGVTRWALGTARGWPARGVLGVRVSETRGFHWCCTRGLYLEWEALGRHAALAAAPAPGSTGGSALPHVPPAPLPKYYIYLFKPLWGYAPEPS